MQYELLFSEGKFWTHDYAILLHVNLRSENMIFLSNKTEKAFSLQGFAQDVMCDSATAVTK